MWTVAEPRVLLYHGFTEEPLAVDPENLFVTRRAFEEQLQFVRWRRWSFLDADTYLDIAAGRRTGRRSVLITIDDALTSVVDIAAPVLASAKVPAVLFVPVGMIGEPASWMTDYVGQRVSRIDDLRMLANLGIELGVHGYHHVNLVDASDAELRQATCEARDLLADLTGQRPRLFAYPYGNNDERARLAVREAGYQSGFSVFNDAGLAAVSRVDVNATDTMSTFMVKLLPGYRVAWRLAARAPRARARIRRMLTQRGSA